MNNKFIKIELDLPDHVLLKATLIAHDKNMTLNDYLISLLEEFINNKTLLKG